MENHDGSAAPPNDMGKGVAMPNLRSSAEATATVIAASNDDCDLSNSKGKSVAAADHDDDKEIKPHNIAERKRRNQMRDYYGELKALIPQIPDKSDKATIVAHAIDYIKYLEETKAILEMRKQVVAEAAASSSSAPPPPPPPSPPPQSFQGMAVAAAMSSDDVPDACSVAPPLTAPAPQMFVPAVMSSSDVPLLPPQPLAGVVPAPPAPQQRVTATPVGFQTWSWPNLVLSVTNDNAYIYVCAPRHRGMWTLVMVVSVLNRHGIEAVTLQVDSDDVNSVFVIYAGVTEMVQDSLPLHVYQLAVSEILVWLTT